MYSLCRTSCKRCLQMHKRPSQVVSMPSKTAYESPWTFLARNRWIRRKTPKSIEFHHRLWQLLRRTIRFIIVNYWKRWNAWKIFHYSRRRLVFPGHWGNQKISVNIISIIYNIIIYQRFQCSSLKHTKIYYQLLLVSFNSRLNNLNIMWIYCYIPHSLSFSDSVLPSRAAGKRFLDLSQLFRNWQKWNVGNHYYFPTFQRWFTSRNIVFNLR